jgi:uncharacterized protein involved in outer membrane biogenesis
MTLPKFKQDDIHSNDIGAHPTNGGDSFDDAPRRGMPKALKWMAGTAVGLVILAGVGGVVATQMIDQQKYKSLIVAKVEEATGYTVDWEGNISLGMMPLPHASISKLTVKAGDAQVLSIAKADIRVALMPLLSKKVEIKNITIDEPVVTMTTTKAGVQTWVAKPKESGASASESKADGSSDASAMDVVVNNIEINDGSFIIDNQQSGSRQELKNLNLKVRADSLKGPFDVTGDTEWSGQKIEVKATSGEVNVSEGSYPIQASVSVPSSGIDASFSGVVDSKKMGANGDVNLEVDDVAKAVKGMTGTAPALPEGIGGKAALVGKVVYSSSRVAVDDMALSLGALSYSGAVAANGLDGDEQPQLSFQLQPKSKAAANAPALVQLLSDLTIAVKGSVENDKMQITTANIKTMGNNISVNGYSTMGANPTVDLTVNASEINLDALTQTAGGGTATDAKAAVPAKPSGDMGFAMPFSGRVRADVAKLTTGGKTYSNIKADVTSNAGALTIANADVSLVPDTSVNVSGKISNTANLSGLNLKVAAKTQDTEKLFSTLGVTMPELPRKVGAASVNGNFTGDLKNLGFSAVVSALQFNLKGEGTVGDPMGTPAINSLKFNISHPNFNDAMKVVQPGFTGSTGFFGPLDVSGDLSWGADKVDVKSISGKLGQTTVDGNISAVTKPKTKVSGALNFGAIVFPSATNNGGTVAATSKSAAPVSSGDHWSRDPIDTAWMRSFDADVAIKAKSITQNMWKLSDVNLAFKLNDGTLTLDDVSAGLFGGRASINGVVKSGAAAKDPLSITGKMNANNVNAQELMSAVMGKASYVMSGTISNLDVSVASTGGSVANLIQTLDGTGTMNGKDITVTGVDIVALSNAAGGSYKPLDRLGALSKTVGSSNQTKFDTFASEFAIEDGIVNVKKATFENSDATMNTTGNVNLPAWTLNLTNKLIMKSNEAEPITFTINGSLDNPAQSGLQNLLMNRVDKLINKDGTTLNKALGKLLGNKNVATETTGTDAAPATTDGAETPAAAQPAAKTDKEKAVQEGVKALQGLFGK